MTLNELLKQEHLKGVPISEIVEVPKNPAYCGCRYTGNCLDKAVEHFGEYTVIEHYRIDDALHIEVQGDDE